MKSQTETIDLNRRDFLRDGSFASLMVMLGTVELRAQNVPDPKVEKTYAGDPVNVALIGCGQHGREILRHLALLGNASVVATCDTYPAMLRRTKDLAPKAEPTEDYKQVLGRKDVEAVVIATPSHQHKQIVLDALAAGKHVYCEAPLANTIEDARAIAKAAQDHPRFVFQSGLQMRSDPQRRFLLDFVRAGAAGRNVYARAQWQKKTSWRQASPNPERELAVNWRLRSETSLGLVGEIGMHQIDVLGWFMNARPVAVTGHGHIVQWNDGRDVPDTVHASFEFPGHVMLNYSASLANSFDADYEMIYGTDAAVMLRQNKAWMFKEVDAPLLGWEVYARKDTFYKETGIALVANATKLVAQGDKPVEEAPFAENPLHFALESFLINVNELKTGVEDFNATFNPNDTPALVKYLASIKRQPAAGYREGYEAAVTAIVANQAIQKRTRIPFSKEWFDIG
ncbi:MAG: Gfo/Idh/MocA family oxidoreductase [Verrucomicrobia bacterium]|nr:Gfo/Idh/MocA family oxidoreductase [Verrucomicrobiota bacterium]